MYLAHQHTAWHLQTQPPGHVQRLLFVDSHIQGWFSSQCELDALLDLTTMLAQQFDRPVRRGDQHSSARQVEYLHQIVEIFLRTLFRRADEAGAAPAG